LAVSTRCFLGRSDVGGVAVELRPPPPPLKTVVEPAAQTVATVATAVSAFSGSPTGAVVVARTALVANIAACDRKLDTELGANDNPSRGAIGDTPVRYFAGAAVYNSVLLLSFAAAQLAVAAARKCATGDSLAACLSWVRFPSLSLFPLLYLLQPTAAAAFALVVSGAGAALMVVGLVVAAALLAGGGAIYLGIFRAFGAKFVRNDLVTMRLDAEEVAALSGETAARARWRRATFIVFAALGEWEDCAPAADEADSLTLALVMGHGGDDAAADNAAGASFVRRNFLFFADYSDRFTAFILVETAVSFAMGLLGALTATLSVECSEAAWALLALLGGYFALMLWMRPHESRFNLWFMAGTALLEWVATVFALANTYAPSAALLTMVEVLLTAVLVASALKAVYDVAHVAVGVLRRRTRALMEDVRAKRRNDAQVAAQDAAQAAIRTAAAEQAEAAREAARMEPVLKQRERTARGAAALQELQHRFVELTGLADEADAQAQEMHDFAVKIGAPPAKQRPERYRRGN
jgi:hypothetical protein